MLAGDAEQVSDPTIVAEIAALWAQSGWPAQPDDVGNRHHRTVQRPGPRTAAVVRLRGRAPHRDRGRHRRGSRRVPRAGGSGGPTGQAGGMASPLTLMAVHAHPDDESSSTGGVFALYADEGIRTMVVTCTNGEHGDAPGGVKPGDAAHDEAAVVAIRLAELHESCELLGVDHLELLGYHDSGMVEWENKHRPARSATCPSRRAAAASRRSWSTTSRRSSSPTTSSAVTIIPTTSRPPRHGGGHRRTGIPAKLYFTARRWSDFERLRTRLTELGVDVGPRPSRSTCSACSSCRPPQRGSRRRSTRRRWPVASARRCAPTPANSPRAGSPSCPSRCSTRCSASSRSSANRTAPPPPSLNSICSPELASLADGAVSWSGTAGRKRRDRTVSAWFVWLSASRRRGQRTRSARLPTVNRRSGLGIRIVASVDTNRRSNLRRAFESIFSNQVSSAPRWRTPTTSCEQTFWQPTIRTVVSVRSSRSAPSFRPRARTCDTRTRRRSSLPGVPRDRCAHYARVGSLIAGRPADARKVQNTTGTWRGPRT